MQWAATPQTRSLTSSTARSRAPLPCTACRRCSRQSSHHTSFQVYESLFFGKILTIDGALMITERDESNYHESLVHTTMAYLPHAKRVLVIGGGDGGTVTQL